ncbi:Hypothetical protein, putative [Bodo saltans]|uniref:Uncharacterized protein n=1 Tax=Bodo saltans TaxID=75058 RepID=A0A0S4JNP3_BODSA|nr:Hypothetical protein, putative [Bodo saltans]|eukprot:CUG91758.1 Hypothetical protein, putative [Bodo saltans]
MVGFRARVSFSSVDVAAPLPLWSVEANQGDGTAEVLLCKGHCKIPIASSANTVRVDPLDSPLPPSHDSAIMEIADTFFTSAQTYLRGQEASITSQLVWFLSASRSSNNNSNSADGAVLSTDPHFLGPVKSEAALLVAHVFKHFTMNGKLPLYVDILSDNCGVVARDFPKSTDGTSPTSVQKVASAKHLDNLVTVLCTRKANPKAVKTISLLVLSPEIFDIVEWMALLSGGALPEEVPPPPLLVIGFIPTTSATTQSANASYVHVTQQLLCVHRPLSDTQHHHMRGGVGSLSSSLHQHTDCSVDVILFVQQQYEAEDDDPNLVPASNLPLVDLIVSQNIERTAPGQLSPTSLNDELVAARQRISKLEMLLKLKSSASSSDVKDQLVFQKWSDSRFEVDVLREIVMQQESQISGLHRHIATLQPEEALLAAEAEEASLAAPPSHFDVVVSPEEDNVVAAPSNHVVDTGVGSSLAIHPAGIHPQRPFAHVGLPMTTVLSPHLSISSPTSGADAKTVSSSSSDTSDSDSSDTSSDSSSSSSQSLQTLLQEARRERLQAKLQRSFNNNSLYSHELEDDLAKEDHALGVEDGARVIRWDASVHRTRRQIWTKMYRSIQKASRKPNDAMATVIPVADVLKFFDATFDCGLASTTELVNLSQCIHNHHLPSTDTPTTSYDANGSTSSLVSRPWVNTRLALSAAWNPLRMDVPKVTFLQLDGQGKQLTVGQTLRASFSVIAPKGQETVRARLRWYRSHPTAKDPNSLHLIRELSTPSSGFESVKRHTFKYRISSDDAGSYIWFEVVPRTTDENSRTGAAASVASKEIVELSFRVPQLLHLRLCKRSGDYDHPIGRYVFAGDVITVSYELVGWPLEGRSVIRWLSSPSNDTTAPRRVECVTNAPCNSIVVPSSCAYQALLVEVTPMELASGQLGATVASLAVVVLPRPQVVHVMAPQLERVSLSWSYTWSSGSRSSLIGIWTADSLEHLIAHTHGSEGALHCKSVIALLMQTIPSSKPVLSGVPRQELPPVAIESVLKLLRADSTSQLLERTSSSFIAAWEHFQVQPTATTSAAPAVALNSLMWRDIVDVREVLFPQEERLPSIRSDRPCFVLVTVYDAQGKKQRIVIAFSNALSAEIFIHLVRYLKSLTKSLQPQLSSLSPTSIAVEAARAQLCNKHGVAFNSVNSSVTGEKNMLSAVRRAWFRCWKGDEEPLSDEDYLAGLSIEEKVAFTSRLFPFLCE